MVRWLAILQQQTEQEAKSRKKKTCEVWIVLYRQHTHSSMSTRARAGGGQVIGASRQKNGMPNLSDIIQPSGFACAWIALGARTASTWLLASFRYFESPEHVPQTSARARTCAVVYGQAPCVLWSRAHENSPLG